MNVPAPNLLAQANTDKLIITEDISEYLGELREIHERMCESKNGLPIRGLVEADSIASICLVDEVRIALMEHLNPADILFLLDMKCFGHLDHFERVRTAIADLIEELENQA